MYGQSDYLFELKNKSDEAKTKLNSINLFNIEPIIPSPVPVRYRNKINLSFGFDKQGNIEVGTMQKDKTIQPAIENVYCSNIAISICNFIKDWIINQSNLDPVSYPKLDGFWRHITIHNTHYNSIMLVFHIQSLSKYNKDWDKEKKIMIPKIKKFLDSKKYTLKSIFYQNSESLKETRNHNIYYHIFGEKYIIEKLASYNFKISPSSFFQVNSYTAEIIYNKIALIANLNKDKVVLDVCCGTGTIGIFLANKCYKVYGIDSNSSCINDANDNSKINNISNIEFINKTAEDGLKDILESKDIIGKDIVAIVNPPRRGLYSSVIETLNKCSNISQLIYVSCNINSLIRDIRSLNIAKPKNITDIIQVDQFPKTNFYEIILNIND